jgi:hypothetical protein
MTIETCAFVANLTFLAELYQRAAKFYIEMRGDISTWRTDEVTIGQAELSQVAAGFEALTEWWWLR